MDSKLTHATGTESATGRRRDEGRRLGLRPSETLALYPAHDGTLTGLFDSRLGSAPERPFLQFGNRSWSWGEFAETRDRLARALAARSVRRCDRVALMAPNSDAYVLLFFALARLGAILVPVNPEFSAGEAGYILAHAEVSTLICSESTLSVARQAVDAMGTSPDFLLIGAAAEGVPGLDDLLRDAADATDATDATDAALAGDVGADDICLIMYTSGTTGFPKGVMHSQRNFVMAGEGFVERMHLQPDDRLLTVLPLFHINALFYSLGGAVSAGASLVLAPRFSASGFWQLAAESGATEVNIIAAIGNILARRPRAEFVPEHRLTKVYGAPISREIADAFQHEFAVPTVIEGYGMTEIPGACNLPFTGPDRIGSMGRPALHPDPGVRFAELRVVDDDGDDVADGETGELLVRTPIVMKGYYKDAEQTQAAFRDGWFITGDLVRRDDEGYYYFVARKKDIIRRRGENVSGAELDRVIGLHPAVAQAAAIAVPAELGEDEILVAVVTHPGASVSAAEIGAWCAKRLAASKRPRYVAFVDTLPQTPTHRVAKYKLKQEPGLLAKAVDLKATPGPCR